MTAAKKLLMSHTAILGVGSIYEFNVGTVRGAAQDSNGDVFVLFSDGVVMKLDTSGNELAQRTVSSTGMNAWLGIGVQNGTDDVIVHGGTSSHTCVVSVENNLSTVNWAKRINRTVNPAAMSNYGGFGGANRDQILTGAAHSGQSNSLKISSDGATILAGSSVNFSSNTASRFSGFNAHGYDYIHTAALNNPVVFTFNESTNALINIRRIVNSYSTVQMMADSSHVFWCHEDIIQETFEIHKLTAPTTAVANQRLELIGGTALTECGVMQPDHESDDMYVIISNDSVSPHTMNIAKLNNDLSVDADQLRITHASKDVIATTEGSLNACMGLGDKMCVGGSYFAYIFEKDLDMTAEKIDGDIEVESGTYIEQATGGTFFNAGLSALGSALTNQASTPSSVVATSKSLDVNYKL